jgi:SAM-dependent methyltransferase
MPENAYHQIPYLTGPMVDSHPDRLASVASLFGMTPAPVTSCRVLEIGCGSGGNIIPMAFRLPGSRFTGVDLADQPIAEGQRVAGELELANLELIAMDLCDIGPALGEFDYIIAHGVYSWVADPIRDRLLAVCRERLAPQGVAYISYNALPGRYVRTMLRDMMIYHTRNTDDPWERMEQARSLLRKLGEAHMVSAAWQPMVEAEIQMAFTEDVGWFFHDDLEPVNDPFYFRDFAACAARHSLQYLGDARPHLMFDSRTPIDWVGGDVLEREQYFDFLCLRAFRQTLLCASEVRLARPAGPERMDRFQRAGRRPVFRLHDRSARASGARGRRLGRGLSAAGGVRRASGIGERSRGAARDSLRTDLQRIRRVPYLPSGAGEQSRPTAAGRSPGALGEFPPRRSHLLRPYLE